MCIKHDGHQGHETGQTQKEKQRYKVLKKNYAHLSDL